MEKHIFRIYDTNNDGHIDFIEFMVVFHVLSGKWCAKCQDVVGVSWRVFFHVLMYIIFFMKGRYKIWYHAQVDISCTGHIFLLKFWEKLLTTTAVFLKGVKAPGIKVSYNHYSLSRTFAPQFVFCSVISLLLLAI